MNFGVAASHAAIHRGLVAVVFAGGGLVLFLRVGIVRTLLRRLGNIAVQGTHAIRAADHAPRLERSRPSGRPEQKHGQQAYTRPPAISRGGGTWMRRVHCCEKPEYRMYCKWQESTAAPADKLGRFAGQTLEMGSVSSDFRKGENSLSRPRRKRTK